MDKFDGDEHASMQEENLCYPWALWPEWELASFLLCLSLSMAAVDKFLSLDLVSQFTQSNHYISLWYIGQNFRTVISHCSRSSFMSWDTSCRTMWKFTTKKTFHLTQYLATLYHWDPIKCLQSLMNNSLLKDAFHFEPLCVFKTAEILVCIYSEWRPGDVAWEMQVGS